jgi:hypothetical protein
MSDDRRRRILGRINASAEPVTGTELARELGVSRQIVVQDMAILRAAGADVIATPRGYIGAGARHGRETYREVLAVQHPPEMTEAELTALVDVGLRVVDVIVEHRIYGELRGLLMIESRADVAEFMQRIEGAELLSTLTRGVHLHTVESSRAGAIAAGREALRRLGILL